LAAILAAALLKTASEIQGGTLSDIQTVMLLLLLQLLLLSSNTQAVVSDNHEQLGHSAGI